MCSVPQYGQFPPQQYPPPQHQAAPQYPPPQYPPQQYPPQQAPGQYPPQQQYAPPPQPGMGYSPQPQYAAGPSMEDLARNVSAGATNQTVHDSDVKVLDPYGRQVPQPEVFARFEQAPFPRSIIDDLIKAGFPAPSQIQQYCWPLAARRMDVIGIAATGSGKTLAFLLPAFTDIIQNQRRPGDPSLLVMAPTRELAIQIEKEAQKFGTGISTICVYGGAPKHTQASALRSGVNAVIGTPGRINDFLEGRQLRLGKVEVLVLDEADRMLDMGFEPQIRKILKEVPSRRNTLFFTATWPKEIQRLANEFLREAYQVQVGNRDELKANQDITQLVKIVTSSDKNNVLCQVLRQAGVAGGTPGASAKGLIFCTTKRMCDELSRALTSLGVPSEALHGDKDQHAREKVLNDLKDGRIQLLVATDVAARGLDIKGVTLVVNYDLPNSTEDYVHRIGRTGRAGAKGYAVTLATDREAFKVAGIVEVMKKSNQVVPPELQQLADSGAGGGGGRSRGGKGGGKSRDYDDRGRDRSRSRGRGRY